MTIARLYLTGEYEMSDSEPIAVSDMPDRLSSQRKLEYSDLTKLSVPFSFYQSPRATTASPHGFKAHYLLVK